MNGVAVVRRINQHGEPEGGKATWGREFRLGTQYPWTQSVLQPGNSADALTTGITWSERMKLESEDEHHNNSDTSKTVESISSDKIHVGNSGISSLCRTSLLLLHLILTR